MTVRLERGEGNARMFWEITRAKTSVTTRYGKYLSTGRTTPAKTYDSTKAAEQALAEALAQKRKEGYSDVRPRAEAGATSKKGVSAENPELEALIEEDPTDAERYLVYADWLQQQGDPRGELIVIQHGIATSADARAVTRLERDANALFKKYEDELLGPLAPLTFIRHSTRSFRTFSWRHGFIRGARLGPLRYRGEEPTNVLANLLRHPAGRFLEHLVLGPLPPDWSSISTVLRAHAPATLTSVVVGDCATANATSSFETFWSAMPRLRALGVLGRVETMGTIEAPLLEALRFGNADEALVDRLLRARLPAVKSLELVLSPGYGGSRVPDLLEAFPALEHLGVTCWTTTDFREELVPRDELAIAVARAAAERKLSRVDLGMPLSPAGVTTLCQDAGALRSVGAFHIPSAGVNDRDALATALPVVWTDDPEEAEPDLLEIDAAIRDWSSR